MKFSFLFLFTLLIVITNSSICQPNPYIFKYLTVDAGLSHTDANDIAQDEEGYIWIGTYFGLDRYDGYSIKKYYNNSLPIQNAFRNRITSVYPDKSGIIWLNTEDGLESFDTHSEQYICYKNDNRQNNPRFEKICKPAGNDIYGILYGQLSLYSIENDTIRQQNLTLPDNVEFHDMASDAKGAIYIASNKGVWMANKNRTLKKITIEGLSDENTSTIYFDNLGNLLIANGKTIIQAKTNVEPTNGTGDGKWIITKKFTCGDKLNGIKNIVQQGKSDYWINAGNALVRLDNNLNYIHSLNTNSSLHSLNSSSLSKIFIDRSECLWVCTFGGGVNYCDLNQKRFYTLQHNPELLNSLSGNHIRSVLEDGENLWIGTTSNGLNLFNTKTGVFSFYNTYNSPLRLKNDVITALTLDNDKNLWIGSDVGIEILRPNKKELWKPSGCDSFPKYIIDILVKDCFGNIWFGNHTNRSGVIWKDDKGHFHVKYYGEGFFIIADKKKPQLFISSTHGLQRVIIDSKGNIVQSFRYEASSDANSLSSNYTYPICQQNDSTYWIGTIGGGLNCLTLQQKNNSYRIHSYSEKYGIFKDVESLEIDNNGNLWMGGNGLECFNPVTGKLVRYIMDDGLQGNSFKVAASYKGADGRLYFGGINGLNYFYPDQIQKNNISAKAAITGFRINNQQSDNLDSATADVSINRKTGESKHLTLDYLDNNFVIFFSSMHFANPIKCKYRYKLIDFDKEWKYTDGANPSATYNNLDYKSYRFIVEATNNDGIWSQSEAQMFITITPPWWKSDIAKIVYLLLITSGLLGIYFYQAKWYRLKREIAVREINENKKEEIHKHKEELYQQQLVFFTNVSHEFRTPLTLILGPLQNLIKQNRDEKTDSSYQLMLKNGKRLTNLISELMNFKKVTDSVIKLQVQPVEVNKFCEDLALEFQHLAISKDIAFEIIDDRSQTATGWFDIQILEKILFNLLINSFKYTNIGGQISLQIFFDIEKFRPSYKNSFRLLYEGYRAKEYIYFCIADSGIGISNESITMIFDRYYRISKNHLGSGVGLALVKSLTQLHKGDIYVYSERYKGTQIIIGIPWGEENYDECERKALDTEPQMQLEPIDTSTLLSYHYNDSETNAAQAKGKKSILLVDDNEELRLFLKQALQVSYQIYEAKDGISAIETAIEKVPDLIISDIMMPGSINGIMLCKLMKERFETSHIPFIILSAKDALDTKIEGMESGADFYFAKPLSIHFLLLTVHNIFEQNKKLKLRYTNDYLSEATELVQSEKDKEFLQQLLTLIENNMKEPDLDVEFLCKHLHISRTKLYQKIKSVSDQSVGEFIRTFRLKKAVHIMTHEDISMNEIVDRIGMQSSSNFSRAFKKEYGKSPLQFMQSLKKEHD